MTAKWGKAVTFAPGMGLVQIKELKAPAGTVAGHVTFALTLLFAGTSTAFGMNDAIVSALRLFNLRVLSLFCVVIAFAAVWVAIALVYRVCRTFRAWF